MLHQNLLRTIQDSLRVGETCIRIKVTLCLNLRIQSGVRQQRLSQWCNTRLTRDLSLGATLRFVRQVEILEIGLGGCTGKGRAKLIRQLALLFH